MKKGVMAKKAQNLTIILIISSMISLFFVSLIPWLSVEESNQVKENLHFNFEMIKKSSNPQISSLSYDINLIIYSFWLIIIFSIISFLGSTIHASGKYIKAGQILLFFGCITLILLVFSIYLQIKMPGKINEIEFVNHSSIISPFYYLYLILISSIIALLSSISYTWAFSSHSIQKYKELKEQKKEKTKQLKKSKLAKKKTEVKIEKPLKVKKPAKIETPILKKQPIIEKKPVVEEKTAEPKVADESEEVEQWLAGQVKEMEKEPVEEKTVEPKKEPEIKEKETKKQIFPEEKSPITKEESEEIKEIPVSKSFEDALSSAIQKKQGTKNNSIPKEIPTDKKAEEPPKEEKPATEEVKEEVSKPEQKKEFNVKCPECKHIFSAVKGEGPTKIKCPMCGKEGIIK